jgi:hypothetical protein
MRSVSCFACSAITKIVYEAALLGQAPGWALG